MFMLLKLEAIWKGLWNWHPHTFCNSNFLLLFTVASGQLHLKLIQKMYANFFWKLERAEAGKIYNYKNTMRVVNSSTKRSSRRDFSLHIREQVVSSWTVVGLGWFPLPVHSNGCGFESMVVTRTFSDRRTDDQTMAAGASVTWTHCSVLFEVTWG
jgi:hypothetical protein